MAKALFPGDTVQVSERSWPRRALQWVGSTEPRPALSRQAIVGDVLIALAATLLAVIAVRAERDAYWPVAILTTAPLAARRVAPIVAFFLILLGVIALGNGNTLVSIAAIIFGAYCAVVYSRFRVLALISAPLAGLILTAAFENTTPPLPGRVSALVILLGITVFGNAVRVWRVRAGDSGERLLRAQAEHEAATQRELALERARIASELHDVVTHNVSVMVVQAGAARQLLGAQQDEARSALLAVEASGRTAMAELQHMLGLLCPPGEAGPEPGSLAGSEGLALRPLPGLDELTTLTDRMAAAGLDVELRVVGAPGPVSAGHDLAAYRVIQEALTNVLKHAGTARTVITVNHRPDGLVLEVADDGPRFSGEALSHAHDSRRPAAIPGTGRGLLGLRERVISRGGEFDAGPRPGGGWRVLARFPADEAPVATVNGAGSPPSPAPS